MYPFACEYLFFFKCGFPSSSKKISVATHGAAPRYPHLKGGHCRLLDSLPLQHLAELPLEIWSSLIFPQLPSLQDLLNCAHTCHSWRSCALLSVERLLLPNIDKKAKRKMLKEHTTLLDITWEQSEPFRGCARYGGLACLRSGCGFAGTEQRFGFCSKCALLASDESSQEELDR